MKRAKSNFLVFILFFLCSTIDIIEQTGDIYKNKAITYGYIYITNDFKM